MVINQIHHVDNNSSWMV